MLFTSKQDADIAACKGSILRQTRAVSTMMDEVDDYLWEVYQRVPIKKDGTGDFTLPFDLTYEVDLWGKIRRTVNASREEAQASAADVQTASLSLHAELALDYFELRSADAQKQLLDDTVTAYTNALQLTQNLFVGGAAPKADVAQAKTQLDGARVEDTDITVVRAQYEHAIATLVGLVWTVTGALFLILGAVLYTAVLMTCGVVSMLVGVRKKTKPAGEGWFIVNAREAKWLDGASGLARQDLSGRDGIANDTGFGVVDRDLTGHIDDATF